MRLALCFTGARLTGRGFAAPLTAGLPFVDSPTGLLLCLAGYFAVVLTGLALNSGRTPPPPESKRPDPLWLRLLVLLHNVFLVGLSLYMSLGCAEQWHEAQSLWNALLHSTACKQLHTACAVCSVQHSRSSRALSLSPGSVSWFAYQGGYKLWGVPFRPSETDMARMIYIFFVSKIYEFMDTFIMLLKGNVQQARAALHMLPRSTPVAWCAAW